MKHADEILKDGIEEWRLNKGIGTAFIPKGLDPRSMLLYILQNIYAKSSTCSTIIIVHNFYDRTDVVEFITHQEDDENNKEFKRLLDNKNIRVLTHDYVDTLERFTIPFLCIVYKLNVLNEKVKYLIEKSRFKLAILNTILVNNADTVALYKHCPVLTSFKDEVGKLSRDSTPIEETRIGLTLDEDSEDYKLLQHYNDFISTSINIFGDLDNIHKAYTGDKKNNLSALQICNQLATNNGWHDKLDMSVEYNRQIDELYNPNRICERAQMTYEIIRNRARLLSDNPIKLKAILDYVNEHKDEKILIINKRGEFASQVTDYINSMSETTICGNYHNNVEPIPACDIDGNPIYVKSGNNKGERRMYSVKAQKTFNVERFNKGIIRVLSTNSLPDVDLNIKIDHILISSTQCLDIRAYLYRLSKVETPQTLKFGQIYISNSLEEAKLEDKIKDDKHILTDTVKNANTENNISDFIIAD